MPGGVLALLFIAAGPPRSPAGVRSRGAQEPPVRGLVSALTLSSGRQPGLVVWLGSRKTAAAGITCAGGGAHGGGAPCVRGRGL